MARPKKERAPIEQMKKPKWKIGDVVDITFLGAPKKVRLTELRPHPQHSERWIYTAVSVNDSIVIPFIGVDGSEQFANIWSKKKNSIED